MATRTVEDWQVFLSAGLERPVQVSYGRSRGTPVQVRWNTPAPQVRFHAMFAEAPDAIAAATLAWLRHGRRARRACRELDGWIQTELASLPPARPRRMRREASGAVHDLEALVAELCERELRGAFGGASDGATPPPALTWGRRVRSRSRHTLQLGSYSTEQHLVRVHPVLDQPAVPAWFVRFVLFHELLHALIPVERDDGRRWCHHGPEFRERERAHPDYARAVAWERRHLPALIRSARSGKPLPARVARDRATVLERLQGLLFPV